MMSDDEVRVAVCLHLGIPLCEPHKCSGCVVKDSAYGVHGLSCRFSKGHHLRHASLNDVVQRSLEFTKIPCHLEPFGLYRSDGKKPDGASLVAWKGGKIHVWDVTCSDTLAPSYAFLAVHEPGAVAVEPEYRKKLKYGILPSSCYFIPIVVETFGVIGNEAHHFLTDVALRIEFTATSVATHFDY